MVFAAATLATSCGPKPKPAQPVETNEVDEETMERESQNHPCTDPNPEDVKRFEQKLADAKTEEEKQQAQRDLDEARQPVCAPYGAPPARRRIV